MLLKLIPVSFFFISISLIPVESQSCTKGCGLALASYYVWEGENLEFISEVLASTLAPFPTTTDYEAILSYNKQVFSKDNIVRGTRLNVPFPCDCINGEFLGHVFEFKVRPLDTYDKIVGRYYANLTTVDWFQRFNIYPETNLTGTVNVTVNCSCGDASISKDYGLFVTYPLRPNEILASVLNQTNLPPDSSELVQRYNPGVNLSSGTGLVYVPGRDANDSFRPLKSSTGISRELITGIVIAAIAVLMLLPVGLYVGFFRKKKTASQELSTQGGNGRRKAKGHKDISIDTSVKFSYEELAQATDSFSMAHKIGEGGFGAVYYAELRGEKVAIKKMGMQASKEFLAELKVLTNVHHLNLVHLIGFCIEGSLFLVYEYIENGNLSQHLLGSGNKDPLPWSTRVQIALDSARGLEYIHEHTVPVCIHCDIKSANILIDRNFRGKVADFGLARLSSKAGSGVLLPSGLIGTFGYMAPEYAKRGQASPKVDVYAFGVVLYELISAKAAVVETNDSELQARSLVTLFGNVLNQPDPREGLCKLIDPRLGGNCPLELVLKIAQLAKACTEENPKLRPNMRSIVVALTTFSSCIDYSFIENQSQLNHICVQ